MAENELFNSRYKFLIILLNENNVEEIFKYLWKEYFIFNIILIDIHFKIYTWFPYDYSSKCGEIINVIELNKTNSVYYPEKIPQSKFPYSCPIRLMPFQAVPYLFNYKSKDNPGLDIIMFNTIAERLNLTNVFVENPYPHYGFKLSNGTIIYMFGALKRREVDFVFVQVLANESLSYDFDSMYPHMDDAFSWFAPTSLRADRWDSLLTIFDNLTWSLIIITILFMSIIWNYYARIIFIKHKKAVTTSKPTTIIHMSYQQCLMDCWRTILTFSAQNEPQPRIIFLVWLFYCLIIDSAYQSNLVSVLTRPNYGKQVSNIQELIDESNLKYGFYGVIQNGFNDPTNKYAWHIYNTYTVCGLTMECVNRTAFKRDFAAVKSTRQVKFLMPKWYTFDNGRPRLYIFKQKVFSFYYRAEVIKGLPFLDKYNRYVMEFWAHGLFPKWEHDVLQKHIKQKDTDANKITKISVQNMLGVFILLFLGLLGALIRFCYELSTFYNWRNVLMIHFKRFYPNWLDNLMA